MRIFIETGTGKRHPLEVESFDTIAYIKRLIKEKEGLLCWQYVLLFDGMRLEDSKTLADYSIQNESTIDALLHQGGGVMDIYIKTPFNLFKVLIKWKDTTIDDVKAEIKERFGIPVNEQRLMFCGKELDDGGRTINGYGIRGCSTLRLVRLHDAVDVVDIASVKAHKAVLSKDKETVNQAEVGSKRARGDSPSASPRHSERGSSSNGANHVPGLESFLDEEDFGLAWKRSRSLISPYDTLRFESISHRTLIESVANDCVRTLNVTSFLEKQLKEYQDELIKAENEVKMLTERNSLVEDSLRKEKENFKKLVQELDVECSTGTSFLESEDGRRYIATLERQAAKCAVDEFKESLAVNVLVMDRAVSVREDTVKECQSLLSKSGRVSEDIIQLIGPQDEDEEEELEDDDDEEEEEEQEDDDDG